jgi:hypothetical protein
MAKELGFQPKSLIKNIPSPSQPWKAPVKDWIRELYEKKIGSRKPMAAVSEAPPAESRNPEHPWPDNPEIPELVIYEPPEPEYEDPYLEPYGLPHFPDRFEAPSEEDIDSENTRMLRRQALFRWAAQAVAVAMSQLPEIQKVVAFGAVAKPLGREIPRFREFRRNRIPVLHECRDLDLAVWTSDLSALKQLKTALSLGLTPVHDTHYGGVAHHAVDVHIFDAESGKYRGRLCSFGQCPKPRNRECLVEGCGAEPFLRQFERYSFRASQFESEPKVTLFDRESGFRVHLPTIDAKPARFVPAPRDEEADFDDEDVPF